MTLKISYAFNHFFEDSKFDMLPFERKLMNMIDDITLSAVVGTEETLELLKPSSNHRSIVSD